MTYAQACAVRDKGLTAYAWNIENAAASHRSALLRDYAALERDYDEWIAARFPDGPDA